MASGANKLKTLIDITKDPHCDDLRTSLSICAGHFFFIYLLVLWKNFHVIFLHWMDRDHYYSHDPITQRSSCCDRDGFL